MSKATISIALKIAQLQNEHSERELREAVEVLRTHGFGGALLDYISNKTSASPKGNKDQIITQRKPLPETTSRAVLNLKDKDPEKFRVLFEFDSLVRRGQLLPANEDLRRLGERVSKSFEAKKSRKETVNALMTVLSDRPINEIEDLVEYSATLGVSGATDEYQRLASFLIKGKS